MTDSGPRHHRRRRSRRLLRRGGRLLGVDRGRGRLALLVIALLVLLIALAVAITGAGKGSDGVAVGSPTASPSRAPSPRATLPIVPTASPLVTPSPRPEGIVARRIRIARLGIDLRIVEGDGIDAPLNRAAHYPGTGWPDGGTNIYIYAHAQEGMFLTLWEARVGDTIELDLVDGTIRQYVVTEVKPRVPWNAVEYLRPTPSEQLTLQTSTSYTPTAPRFIVIAEPAP